MNFEKDKDRTYHFRLGLDYDISQKSSIGFTVDNSSTKHDERGDYRLAFIRSTIDSLIHTQSTLNKKSNTFVSNIYFKHVFRKNEELNVSADYLKFSDRSIQDLGSHTFIGESSQATNNFQLTTNSPFTAEVYNLRSDYEVKMFKSINFSSGLQTIYSIRRGNGMFYSSQGLPIDSLTYLSKNKENVYAGYVNFSTGFKRFNFQAGLRVEGSVAEVR